MASSKALKSAMRVLDSCGDNVTRLKASKIISDISIRVLDRFEKLGYKVDGGSNSSVTFYEVSFSSDKFEDWCKKQGYKDVLERLQEYRKHKQEEAKKKQQHGKLVDGRLSIEDYKRAMGEGELEKPCSKNEKKHVTEEKEGEGEEEAKLELVD